MYLLTFIAKRLGALIITVLVSSLLVFGAVSLAPGDPAALLAGSTQPNPELLAAIRAKYHLDDPFIVQYLTRMGGLLTGDLGTSIMYRTEVSTLLERRLPNTLFLVGYSATLILTIGIGLGIVAAIRGRATRNVITAFASIAMAAPTFVMAIVLIWVFAVTLGWFPVFGAGEGFLDQLWHMTMPALSLSFSIIAYLAQITRQSLASEMNAEHVMTSRSRGLGFGYTFRRHILWNAAAPILAASGIIVAGLFAGTAVVERAFGVPGLGSLLVESALTKDVAVVQTLSLMMIIAFVVANAIVDLINVMLDQRLAREVNA